MGARDVLWPANPAGRHGGKSEPSLAIVKAQDLKSRSHQCSRPLSLVPTPCLWCISHNARCLTAVSSPFFQMSRKEKCSLYYVGKQDPLFLTKNLINTSKPTEASSLRSHTLARRTYAFCRLSLRYESGSGLIGVAHSLRN